MIRVKHHELFATESDRLSPMLDLQRSVDNPDWFERAACRDVDPEVFFPLPSESTRDAREICDDCPAKDACGLWAIAEDIRDGIWGGMTPDERYALRKQLTNNERTKKTDEVEAWKRRHRIIELYRVSTPMSHAQIGEKFGVEKRTIERDLRILRRKGLM